MRLPTTDPLCTCTCRRSEHPASGRPGECDENECRCGKFVSLASETARGVARAAKNGARGRMTAVLNRAILKKEAACAAQ